MPEALIVVDVQRGFADPVWGRRDNPACEDNVARLVAAYRRRGEPLVFVRHDSHKDGSPLAAGAPGNAFQDVVTGQPDLLVTKHVNSSFLGDPPLDPWLRVLDATHTFDLVAPDGSVIGADLLTHVTAANLHGEFATVVQTRDVL